MKAKIVIAKFGTVEFEGDSNDLKIFNDALPGLLKTMSVETRGKPRRGREAQK